MEKDKVKIDGHNLFVKLFKKQESNSCVLTLSEIEKKREFWSWSPGFYKDSTFFKTNKLSECLYGLSDLFIITDKGQIDFLIKEDYVCHLINDISLRELEEKVFFIKKECLCFYTNSLTKKYFKPLKKK